jgi:isocitrate dehydrogenase kinase/phosphatase
MDIEFWQGVQRRIASGEVVDVFPYRREARLQRNEGGGNEGTRERG